VTPKGRFLVRESSLTASARSLSGHYATSSTGAIYARFFARVRDMRPPTPPDLAQRLRAAPGSKERFGTTAAAVLETADLVAAADQDWNKDTVSGFLEQQEIHPKVWRKLVAIARSQNLRTLPLKDLPASYTALYALEVMSPQELAAAAQEGVVRSNASSRSILDWTKTFRLRGTGIEQEIPLTLVLREDLTEKQKQDLLEALSQVADQFDAEVLEGKGGVRQAELKADLRKVRAAEIAEELMRLLGSVVLDAPDALKQQFQVTSATDLIEGSRNQFTGFLQVLEGKRDKTIFWRKYGRAYCLKYALDFTLSESRAERFQLKDRVKKAIERWGIENGISGFQETAEDVMRSYMRR
jgi:hypothetical protein